MKSLIPHYSLVCSLCGKRHADAPTGFRLTCAENHAPALLRAQYVDPRFEIQPDAPGMFRFANWLPVRRILPDAPAPVVMHSEKLGQRLGLNRLYFVFSGYWPERGALMTTGSFKELEAPPVCARIPDGERRRLVVSSAGNTARAFLHVCATHEIPAVIVVPEVGLPFLWMLRPKPECVTLVALKGDVDYFDAIRIGNLIAATDGYFPEGGAANVARRDGMGTVLLSFVEQLGTLPVHYFQAVGSGTGAIAVWDMRRRLLEDGRFGAGNMRLHLAQNAPFTPMVDAWRQHSRDLFPENDTEQRRNIAATRAHVLSNRRPPYAIVGGLYDALNESNGEMYAVANDDAQRAGALFMQDEGSDLDPAAEVAVASLFQAVERKTVAPNDLILLNLTGGGYERLKREQSCIPVQPDIVLTPVDLAPEIIAEKFIL
ncbi:hypothetical protein U14_03954 [Candidatus Moduliflexus flocculans]|uniref:Tryptophan synthase beta chain-like PALP domain-containing protein n=1 Tax=Candidatus Moduliflexus flocculans TaxID=1499966 RepID=A0A0S6W2Y0_9BACT|nr:hypothetical protein U14_03954 [Candidatus Moduliflexus flocculans]